MEDVGLLAIEHVAATFRQARAVRTDVDIPGGNLGRGCFTAKIELAGDGWRRNQAEQCRGDDNLTKSRHFRPLRPI